MSAVRVDREFYPPVIRNHHGTVSVTIGDHIVRAGSYNVRMADGKAFGAQVVMLPHQEEVMDRGRWTVVHSDIPHLKLKYNGTTILARIPDKDCMMARM